MSTNAGIPPQEDRRDAAPVGAAAACDDPRHRIEQPDHAPDHECEEPAEGWSDVEMGGKRPEHAGCGRRDCDA